VHIFCIEYLVVIRLKICVSCFLIYCLVLVVCFYIVLFTCLFIYVFIYSLVLPWMSCTVITKKLTDGMNGQWNCCWRNGRSPTNPWTLQIVNSSAWKEICKNWLEWAVLCWQCSWYVLSTLKSGLTLIFKTPVMMMMVMMLMMLIIISNPNRNKIWTV